MLQLTTLKLVKLHFTLELFELCVKALPLVGKQVLEELLVGLPLPRKFVLCLPSPFIGRLGGGACAFEMLLKSR